MKKDSSKSARKEKLFSAKGHRDENGNGNENKASIEAERNKT